MRRAPQYTTLCHGAALALALAPSLAHAQQLAGGDTISVPIVRLVLGLLVCVMVALVAALALKQLITRGALSFTRQKFSLAALTRGPDRHIRVIETHRVSPHADVCRLSCDDREYLVVVGAAGVALLHEKAVAAHEAKAAE